MTFEEQGVPREGVHQGESSRDGYRWPSNGLVRGGDEVIAQMREAVLAGKPWHIALLEAVGQWTIPEETVGGRHFRYLLHGEAFDWLLLAERLCQSLDGLIPQEERERLFFYGQLPQQISRSQFRSLTGSSKYRAFLNFWYGVVVEEALLLVAEEEVRKTRRASGRPHSDDAEEQAYLKIYEESKDALLHQFRQEMGYQAQDTMSLSESNEFTYWLFKRRLKTCEPARVASDTRKALRQLQILKRWAAHNPL